MIFYACKCDNPKWDNPIWYMVQDYPIAFSLRHLLVTHWPMVDVAEILDV